jgi:hypothetical protein
MGWVLTWEVKWMAVLWELVELVGRLEQLRRESPRLGFLVWHLWQSSLLLVEIPPAISIPSLRLAERSKRQLPLHSDNSFWVQNKEAAKYYGYSVH